MTKTNIELFWKCRVCNKKRPDEFISVAKHDMGVDLGADPGVFMRHINYCNDSKDCTDKAFAKENWKLKKGN